jgi:hypothetical protein
MNPKKKQSPIKTAVRHEIYQLPERYTQRARVSDVHVDPVHHHFHFGNHTRVFQKQENDY